MRDARFLSNDALEALRWRAISMVCGGSTQVAAAKALGVHKNTVSLWLKWWREGGDAAVKPKPRGGRGTRKRLNAATEAAIQRLITDNCPDQLNLPFALWTCVAVRALIATRFGIALPQRTARTYRDRWGFSPQLPIQRALECQDVEIRAWLGQEYPKIAARAKAERAEIHWADVTRISNQATRGRGLAHEGRTPVARTAQRHTTSMISTVATWGKERFMLHEGPLNAALFLTFLERLTRDASRKIFLIVDKVIVHHGNAIDQWVDANQQKIELFFLPPCARETK